MAFLTDHTTKQAYLGKAAHDLVRLTSDQVADIYDRRQIIIPVELSSTLHSLSLKSGSSLTEIASTLGLPHQLVAQRVRKLISLGLLERRPDATDGRRFELHLTDYGHDQADRLRVCMRDMSRVYEGLYEEIGCDLPAILGAAMKAIRDHSLVDRFESRGLL
ncbi:MarR family winged helix-turn-helix transcriptional regulator [Algimonas porphyrae]|nr:MarR family transcriptional regulator [Algimonas porphyrae]